MRGRTSQHRRDANHHELTALAEQLGAYVIDLSQLGQGHPDLLVYHCRIGWFPVEVKGPKGTLSQAQKDLHVRVPIYTWRVSEDVYRTLGLIA